MTTKRRILLVDDEARVVQGLQRALRMHRDGWDVVTATSGVAALELIEASPVDVIISDMRMPEMDGATLLGHVRSRSPGTMRIVLSGQTDAEAAFRAMPVAHQFFSKPTDPVALGDLLVRTAAMMTTIPDEAVLHVLGGLDALPSPREVRDHLVRAIAGEAPFDAVVAIVERDPALVLKLLQIVNSAFFGLPRRICDVGEAVAYLGMDLVREICAVGGVMRALSITPPSFDVPAASARAQKVAAHARVLAGEGERGAVAFAAGLLHDIGRLALAVTTSALPDEMHLTVAAYLLDLWGLPRPIVEAVVEHSAIGHDLASRAKLTAADAVWIAQRALDAERGLGADPVERAYLERLGVLEKVRLAA